MSCWDEHPRKGIVANADPRGPVPYDRSGAYYARACCERPRCIAAAKGQVRIHTGEPGIFFPDPADTQAARP
jgi:hypothetical protein